MYGLGKRERERETSGMKWVKNKYHQDKSSRSQMF